MKHTLFLLLSIVTFNLFAQEKQLFYEFTLSPYGIGSKGVHNSTSGEIHNDNSRFGFGLEAMIAKPISEDFFLSTGLLSKLYISKVKVENHDYSTYFDNEITFSVPIRGNYSQKIGEKSQLIGYGGLLLQPTLNTHASSRSGFISTADDRLSLDYGDIDDKEFKVFVGGNAGLNLKLFSRRNNNPWMIGADYTYTGVNPFEIEYFFYRSPGQFLERGSYTTKSNMLSVKVGKGIGRN